MAEYKGAEPFGKQKLEQNDRLISSDELSQFEPNRHWSSIEKYLMSLSRIAVIFPRSLKPATFRPSSKQQPTAYLDALRGYAAWVVYNSHIIHEDWRPETSPLMQFSCFKIIFHGHPMVDVFFVISGYALSYRMVGFIHSKEPGRLLPSLTSSVFRRYLRLYLPTIFASLIAMTLISTGIAVKGEDPQVLQETMLGDLWFWVKDSIRSSDPFPHVIPWWYGGIHGTQILPQMWTIPVEFRGSMILYLFIVATCTMKARPRVIFIWGCILASFWWQNGYAGLFLMGMWLADRKHAALRLSQETSPISTLPFSEQIGTDVENSLSSGQTSNGSTAITPSRDKCYQLRLGNLWISPSLVQQLPYICLFLVSLKFMTGPLVVGRDSPFPYNLIAWTIPPDMAFGAQIHWPLSLGAMLLIYSVDSSPLLQRPLLTPFSQFVGELSFGLYAMHNTLRWIVWERHFVKWQFSLWGSGAQGFFHFLPGYLVMTFMLIWAAELFRRVDVKVVHLTKRVQDLCFE